MFSSAECRHRADTLARSLLMQQPRPLPQFLLVSVPLPGGPAVHSFSAIKKKAWIATNPTRKAAAHHKKMGRWQMMRE
jgi:hypothetical protein